METSQDSSTNALEHYWLIFKRQWLPTTAVFGLSVLLGVLVLVPKEILYEAQGKLKFKKIVATSSLTEVGKEVGSMDQLTETSSPLTTEIEVITSYPIVQKTINTLKLRDKLGQPLKYQDFIDQLSVASVKGADVMKVGYKDIDPKKSARIVNALMQIYLAENIKMNRQDIVAAHKFLEEQLPKAEANSSQAELAVRQFKEENQIVDIEQETTDTVAQINEFQKQINSVKSQVADTQSQSALLKQRLGLDSEQALLLTKLSQSPEVREIMQKLQTAESALASENSRSTAENPAIANLEQEVQDLKALLQQRIQRVSNTPKNYTNFQLGDFQQKLTADIISIEAKQSGLSDQINTLMSAKKNYEERAKTLPKLSQKLQGLVRKQEAAQTTYSQLLKQRQEIRVAENQNIGNVQIIANAIVPDEAINSRPASLLGTIFLAIAAGTATAYILDLTDKSIKTVKDAKRIFGYSCLGVIPTLSKSKRSSQHQSQGPIPGGAVQTASATPMSEAYRILQSNLKYINANQHPLRTIVITSSTAGEGKSAVAANLATTIAQTGRRVILIDSNLRHPIQHQIWDVVNDLGLSNVLSQHLEPSDAVQAIMPNLDLLTAGIVPPNPATLLDSQPTGSLLEYLNNQYDAAILDTPALDSVADAPILGQLADGILLVVKLGVTNRIKADLAKDILMQSGQTVLGLVINGHTRSGSQPLQTVVHVPTENHPDLWDAVSRLAKVSSKNRSIPNMTDKELANTPTDLLQDMTTALEKNLDHFTLLLREEEEELTKKRQFVRQLEQKLSLANSKNQASIEEQLHNEQEKNRMLYKTLIGQRRNLEKRREMLHRYQEILNHRQTLVNGHQPPDEVV
jgi:polysaccharide biosynthesis transport protein